MARGKQLEQELDRLGALRAEGDLKDVHGAVAEALDTRSSLIVARAAELAREYGLKGLEDRLSRAFERFMRDAAKTDKGCLAKIAIVEALDAAGSGEEALLRRAVRHVQLEPVRFGRVDTAARLRAAAALALARLEPPDLLFELLPLLSDAAPEARATGIRVVGHLGGEAAELLLRLLAAERQGDGAVLGECLAALMRANPARSLDFVRGFLADDDAVVVEQAALALGESRLAAAAELLVGEWERRLLPSERVLFILPLALTRDPAAVGLLAAFAEHAPDEAVAPLAEALRLLRGDDQLEGPLRAAIGRHPRRAVSQHILDLAAP